MTTYSALLRGIAIILTSLKFAGCRDGSAKSVETRKHPCSKTGDDGMQQ